MSKVSNQNLKIYVNWKRNSKGEKKQKRNSNAYKSNSGDESIERGEEVENPILPDDGLVDGVPPVDGVLEEKSERRRGSAQHIRQRLIVGHGRGDRNRSEMVVGEFHEREEKEKKK